MRVLSFGEVLIDHIDGDFFLGGAPVNFAINCLNLGLEAQLYSAIGTDEKGQVIKKDLSQHGLDLNFIAELKDYQTGLVEVEMNDGEPSYEIRENVAFDYLNSSLFEATLADQEFDLFYFGTLVQRNAESRQALYQILSQGKFHERFFDCNLRQQYYDPERLKISLGFATIFKANQLELEVIMRLLYGIERSSIEYACKMLSDEYPLHTIIITAGADGAFLYYSDTLKFIPSYKAELLDAVGAGDAFSAAFACNFIAGVNPEECVLKGHKLGRIVAQQKGAIPTISEQLRLDIGL